MIWTLGWHLHSLQTYLIVSPLSSCMQVIVFDFFDWVEGWYKWEHSSRLIRSFTTIRLQIPHSSFPISVVPVGKVMGDVILLEITCPSKLSLSLSLPYLPALDTPTILPVQCSRHCSYLLNFFQFEILEFIICWSIQSSSSLIITYQYVMIIFLGQ